MKLSKLSGFLPAELGREGEFSGLGLLNKRSEDHLVFLESRDYLGQLVESRASCVICPRSLMEQVPVEMGVLLSDQPKLTFYSIHHNLAGRGFYDQIKGTKIHPSARIHPDASIASDAVFIGENTVVGPGAVVLPNVRLGANVTVGPGSILGSEGFQFMREGDEILKVQHAGGVWLEDGVEIQANVCVDRAVFGGYTRIGTESKLDNLVHVAHEVSIGKRCLIAAHAMLAGSVTVEDGVWIGPSACISNGVRIGAGAVISLGSVVTQDVPGGERVTGNFAIDHERFLRHLKDIR